MMAVGAMQADQTVILDHLRHITRRWHELDIECQIEVRILSAEDKAEVKNVARYSPDEFGLEMAAEHIAAMNQHKLNAYTVVNPVRADADIKTGSAAKDEHIAGSFFHWADADDAQAAENIRQFVGPRPTFYVLTGTQPCARPHVYWELEEPTLNMTAWNATQKAIAATLKTDASVVNPSRIMRVAGTVNWPKPKKIAKGYTQEVTQLCIHSEDDRPLVTSERMARAFLTAPAAPAQAEGIHIATGEFERKSAEDYAETLRRARTEGEKHAGVRDLTAALAGARVPRAMTEAIVRDACPVWDANVEDLIESAYKKFYKPEPDDHQFREMSDEERDAVEPLNFKAWGHRDLAAIPYPEFAYSDFYARGYTSVTLAPPKVGKSMLGLAEAIDMATGRGFLTGVPRDKLRVVYYNAEDDQDVIDSRVAALLSAYDIDQSEIAQTLFPVSGVDRDDFFMISGQEGVINETLFVGLEKFINQQGADVLIFDPLQDLSRSPETNEVFRLLGQRLRRMAATTRVALGLIHHTRKIAPGMTPTIDDGRGGSALRGTARFNRLLIGMTEDEAAKAGVQNHRHFMRIADMESNLAPPSSDVNRWFEKVSVMTPNGREIGAIRRWEWPDAFDGVTPQDAARVRGEIDRMAEPPRLDVRSGSWVGITVADVLGLNLSNASHKARVKTMIQKWIETDVLRATEGHDARAGRTIKIVICGANNPTSEGQQ
jgi:hypothetical protein